MRVCCRLVAEHNPPQTVSFAWESFHPAHAAGSYSWPSWVCDPSASILTPLHRTPFLGSCPRQQRLCLASCLCCKQTVLLGIRYGRKPFNSQDPKETARTSPPFYPFRNTNICFAPAVPTVRTSVLSPSNPPHCACVTCCTTCAPRMLKSLMMPSSALMLLIICSCVKPTQNAGVIWCAFFSR
jgi:hypothetical protein